MKMELFYIHLEEILRKKIYTVCNLLQTAQPYCRLKFIYIQGSKLAKFFRGQLVSGIFSLVARDNF